MYKSLKHICAIILTVFSLSGKAQQDSAAAWGLFQQASNTASAEKAISVFQEAMVIAEQEKLKSLKIEIKKALAPLYILNGQNDQGLLTYFQLVNKFTSQKRYAELFNVYIALSDYYSNKQMPESAADYRVQAMGLADTANLKIDKAKILYTIGGLHLKGLKYKKALYYLNKADTLASLANRQNLLLKVLRLSAKAYEYQGDLDKSVVANQRILVLLEQQNEHLLYTRQLNNLGFIEQKRHNTRKALQYFLQTLKEREKLGKHDEENISLLVNIAISYQNLKNNNETKYYLERALAGAKKEKDNAQIAEIYDLISVSYLSENDLYNAQLNNKKGLKLMDGKQLEVEMELDLTASIIYEKLLEYQTALDYYKNYLNIKDSLDLAKRISQEELLQQQLYLHRTEKEIQAVVDKSEIKDYQLEQLKLESKNKDIELKNQELDAKHKLQEARIRQTELEQERTEQELAATKSREENQRLLIKQQELEEEENRKNILLLESDAKIKDLEIERRESINRNLIIIVFLAILVMLLALFAVTRIRKINKEIKHEKDKSDKLLLNILPASTAEELKTLGQSLPRKYEAVTVLFTDFKGFTKITETMQPESLVDNLGLFFKGFDDIMIKHGLEKIKTIGDAYMCAGGIPEPLEDAALKAVEAAKEMLALTERVNAEKAKEGLATWGIRIGLHTGPVVAGVIGNHKFQYDIWGDTVNLAARMESSGEAGKINISEATYNEIKGTLNCTYRGEIAAKNKGNVKMYFVNL